MGEPNADDLIQFAATLEGVQLATGARGKTFTVRRLETGVEFTPLSSGKSRSVTRDMIQRFCDEYQRTRSSQMSDYHELTFDASYLLVLMQHYTERQG